MLADGLKPIPHAVRTGHPADIQLDNTDGSQPFIPPHYPMATDEVRHVGDIVAMVIATQRAAAKDAAELVVVDYADLAAVTHPATRRRAERAAHLVRCHSRTSAWMRQSAMRAPPTLPSPPPPMSCAFTPACSALPASPWNRARRPVNTTQRPDSYTLHAGAGGAVRPRHDMAVVLGVADEQRAHGDARRRRQFRHARRVQSRVRPGRLGRQPCRPTGEMDLRAQRGVPVRLSGARPDLPMRNWRWMRQGISLPCAAPTWSTAAPIRSSFGPLHKGVEIMSSIYHVPAVHFRACATLSNTAPTRPYRSSGRPEAMFVVERLIDIAARQCGFDRVELRRRNLVPETAMPYRNPFGLEYDSGAYHKVMERVLTLGDWHGFRGAPRRERKARGKLSRHRHRQLRRYRNRRAARTRRDHRAAGRRRGSRHRHRFQRPGPRNQFRTACRRMAWRADGKRAAGAGRHRARLGRWRLAFRARAATRQHRHARRVERDHREGHAHRQPHPGSRCRRHGILRRPVHGERHRSLHRHFRSCRGGGATQRPAGRSARKLDGDRR